MSFFSFTFRIKHSLILFFCTPSFYNTHWLLPPSLCTCCSFHHLTLPVTSSCHLAWPIFIPFKPLRKCHFLREAFPDYPPPSSSGQAEYPETPACSVQRASHYPVSPPPVCGVSICNSINPGWKIFGKKIQKVLKSKT